MADIAITGKDLLKHVTVNVRITGGIFGWFGWRRRVGVALIRLAAVVMQVGVEIQADAQ